MHHTVIDASTLTTEDAWATSNLDLQINLVVRVVVLFRSMYTTPINTSIPRTLPTIGPVEEKIG
jgi:hypothetical protein